MDGAEKDYNFSRKRHWRRTVWNNIATRDPFDDAKKDGVVVYLPGVDNLEREIILSKGVPRNNLIGVEANGRNIQTIRNAGQLCVKGDILSVLINWPADGVPISVAFLDLCGDIKRRDFPTMLGVLSLPQTRNAVIAINLQRGREASTNRLRELIRECDLFEGKIDNKHRGGLFMNGLISFMTSTLCKMIGFNPEIHYEPNTLQFVENTMNQMLRSMSPSCFSYKSTSGLVFDSVVFNNPVEHTRRNTAELNGLRKHLTEHHRGLHSSAKIKRNISAVLAHRTMRLNTTRKEVT